jgi:hypothetical protein
MAENHDQFCAQVLDCVLDGTEFVALNDVAGYTHNEDFTKALVEEDFRRNTAVAAGQDNGIGMLTEGNFLADSRVGIFVQVIYLALYETLVTFQKQVEYLSVGWLSAHTFGCDLTNGTFDAVCKDRCRKQPACYDCQRDHFKQLLHLNFLLLVCQSGIIGLLPKSNA